VRIAVLFAVLAGLHAAPARAGDCTSGGPDVVRELEAYAKKPGKTQPDPDHLCIEQGVDGDKALTKRFIAACDRIVARESSWTCVYWSAYLGARKLAGKDIIEHFAAGFLLGGTDYNAMELIESIDDARGVPMVIASWKQNLADKDTNSRYNTAEWARWRHSACRFLGKHGGQSAKAFLDEQALTVKDRGVLKRIRAASDAIAKRLAKAP
jgi:hypothetical protein